MAIWLNGQVPYKHHVRFAFAGLIWLEREFDCNHNLLDVGHFVSRNEIREIDLIIYPSLGAIIALARNTITFLGKYIHLSVCLESKGNL